MFSMLVVITFTHSTRFILGNKYLFDFFYSRELRTIIYIYFSFPGNSEQLQMEISAWALLGPRADWAKICLNGILINMNFIWKEVSGGKMILKNPIMTPPGKEPTCQCRRYKRHGFDPSVEKIPWRRKQQPTPVFLPGESHGQKSLEAYGSWGLTQVSRHAWSFSVFPKRKFWLQLCEYVFFNFANIYIYIYIYICFIRG